MRTMRPDTWLKRAQDAAGQPAPHDDAAVKATETAQQPPQATKAKGTAPPQPQRPQPKPQQQRQPRQNQASVMAALQDVAQTTLPTLNQSLGSIAKAILSRNDIGATEDQAKRLAVEVVGAWLFASANGEVSDMASVIAQSKRINSLLDMA